MMKEAERAKKEMLDFLKKNESTGTAKEDFCELKEKTEQAFFVSLALDLRERRAKLWMKGKHDEVDSWALSKIHEALVSDRKTEVRKITDMVEKTLTLPCENNFLICMISCTLATTRKQKTNKECMNYTN